MVYHTYPLNQVVPSLFLAIHFILLKYDLNIMMDYLGNFDIIISYINGFLNL